MRPTTYLGLRGPGRRLEEPTLAKSEGLHRAARSPRQFLHMLRRPGGFSGGPARLSEFRNRDSQAVNAKCFEIKRVRHREPTGRRDAPPEDRLREAIPPTDHRVGRYCGCASRGYGRSRFFLSW
jgi:hypothetical protein